jgi:hypothetical protein
MNVCFYLPEAHLPSAEKLGHWEEDGQFALEEGGKSAAAQAWIYRTWITLSKSGLRADLVHEIPTNGCVIALSGTVPLTFRLPEKVFFADVVADGMPHPSAHFHIVQNAAHARRLPWSMFMPHWTQPGLVPRDPQRGSTFERVAFFGNRENLAAELQRPSWCQELKRRTGAFFEIRSAELWRAYHDVDAIVAVRDFRGGRQIHKPATKLYNAWMAGVPFIGGNDSAYAAEGTAGHDYLVAGDPHEVLSHLERLKADETFRNALVAQGTKKTPEYTHEAITARWRKLVAKTLPALSRERANHPLWNNACRDLAMRGILAADRFFRS